MTLFFANAFSLNMLGKQDAVLLFSRIKIELVKALLAKGFESVVGHADTAAVLSTLLEIPVEYNRTSIEFEPEGTIIVAQYKGPRLPEGATVLPEGAEFDFWLIENQY